MGLFRGGETSMGGSYGAFPKTTWGLVTFVRPATETDRWAALESLCRKYWKPIYRYIRIRWGKSNDDAKDLTQAFLLWLMEGDALEKYTPERGGFRCYLKLLLGRYVSHQAEALQRLKRGGGTKVFSLDDEVLPTIADPSAVDPEAAFDRAWLAEVLSNAVERVRVGCASKGREEQFRVYEAYELAPREERPTYAALGEKLGISENQVRNHLFAVRARVRAEARAEIRELTCGNEELQEEWRALFGAG